MQPERDFAAWVERRDPAALARVFDATAGRLVLLAVHLAGGRSGAEDLVQATFVAAMAHAASWDRRRPLWPWLAGILQNEARMQLRRQRLRREVGLEHAAAAPADAPDPAALAASDDAFRALVAAIEALPVPYRQVLRLRLLHGLQPIEIARALERPAGTVHAQLHRGLQQLRQALPVGLAVAAAAWVVGEGDLLAQVRREVLARASAMAGAGAAAPVGVLIQGGWWAMHGKTVGLSVAGALLLLLVVFANLPLRGGSDGEPASPVAPAVAGLEEAAPPALPAAPPEREALDAAAGPAWPLEVSVRSPAGPVAGAPVRVRLGPTGFSWKDVPAAAREELASGTTGIDGIFRCSLDELRRRSALFRCTSLVFVAAGDQDREEYFGLPRSTAPHAFRCEIERRGNLVRGRVVDADGGPVAGAGVDQILDADRWVGNAGWSSAQTDAEGRFARAVDRAAWPTHLAVTEAMHGCAMVAVPAPTPAAAGADAGVDLGTIVLDGSNAIRGQVVLGDGSPLGDFPLDVASIDPALAADPLAIRRSFIGKTWQTRLRSGSVVQQRCSPRTAADGSFTCAGLDPDGVYAVSVVDALHSGRAMAVARVGDRVRLVVDMQLLLLDVRGAAGEALPGVTILGTCYDPANQRPSYELRPGFPEKGQIGGGAFFSLDREGRRQALSPFGLVWCLYPTDEIAETERLRHDVFAGVHRAERTMRLQPALQFGVLRLVVVEPDGTPAKHYGFTLRHCERDVQRNHSRIVPPADCTYRDLPAGRWRLTVLLGQPLSEVWGMDTPARGKVEQEIAIADGRTTELRVVSKPAGRVAFRLRASQPPAGGHWQGLQIVADSGGAEVPFEVHSDDQRANPWPLPSIFYLANEALPPGRHGFLVTVDGYQPAHCVVDVVDGRLSTARLELLPR